MIFNKNKFIFKGGFPYWLLTKYPAIKLRTMDKGKKIFSYFQDFMLKNKTINNEFYRLFE